MHRLRPLGAFITKFGNDWAMNLAGLLAYNFLTAIFPLILGMLAIGALVLPDQVIRQVSDAVNAALPSDVTGQTGLNLDFYQMLTAFHQASKLTAVLSFAGFLWTGSNLFGVMDNCFAIVFRVRSRNPLQQKVMALAMVFIFALLAPLAVLAAAISGSFHALSALLGSVPGLDLILSLGGYVVGVAVAFLLFYLIYLVVPNQPIRPGHAWGGALLAALLFVVVSYVFPWYVGHFMSRAWFGHLLLLFGIFALWCWVVAFIVILGAELNAFVALRKQPLPTDLSGVIQDLSERSPPDEQRHGERQPSDVGEGDTAEAANLVRSH